ncbi:hypothetical protein [Streptococcus uberis]|uniref:hypothetical protein n=1 Tax=Streptococcus uberis TaxID=1349 RepID=UPI0011594A22|nr:hypothetical protein [Streptococcus uberis]
MMNPITIPPSPIKPDSKSSLEGYKIIDDYFEKPQTGHINLKLKDIISIELVEEVLYESA